MVYSHETSHSVAPYRGYDQHSASQSSSHHEPGLPQNKPAFTPKFDVVETTHYYTLYGELPGAAKAHMGLEFIEPRAILLHGTVYRQPPQVGAVATEQQQQPPEQPPPTTQRTRRNTVTVEDAVDESDIALIEKHREEAAHKIEEEQRKIKWWTTERNVGEFRRLFEFPEEIDYHMIVARLQHGILKITVPKKGQALSRKIEVM